MSSAVKNLPAGIMLTMLAPVIDHWGSTRRGASNLLGKTFSSGKQVTGDAGLRYRRMVVVESRAAWSFE
jgi:hypothetical protein